MMVGCRTSYIKDLQKPSTMFLLRFEKIYINKVRRKPMTYTSACQKWLTIGGVNKKKNKTRNKLTSTILGVLCLCLFENSYKFLQINICA